MVFSLSYYKRPLMVYRATLTVERSDIMPGAIVGIYGVQRSGKTLIAYKLVKGLQQACKQQGDLSTGVHKFIFSPGS